MRARPSGARRSCRDVPSWQTCGGSPFKPFASAHPSSPAPSRRAAELRAPRDGPSILSGKASTVSAQPPPWSSTSIFQ
eukprot:886511-Pyramimonas_sp.AAC.1